MFPDRQKCLFRDMTNCAHSCTLSASLGDTIKSVTIFVLQNFSASDALLTIVFISNAGHGKFQLDEELGRDYKRWLIVCQLYCSWFRGELKAQTGKQMV